VPLLLAKHRLHFLHRHVSTSGMAAFDILSRSSPRTCGSKLYKFAKCVLRRLTSLLAGAGPCGSKHTMIATYAKLGVIQEPSSHPLWSSHVHTKTSPQAASPGSTHLLS